MATSSMSREMLRYFMQLTDAERKSVLEMLKTFLQGSLYQHGTKTILNNYHR